MHFGSFLRQLLFNATHHWKAMSTSAIVRRAVPVALGLDMVRLTRPTRFLLNIEISSV